MPDNEILQTPSQILNRSRERVFSEEEQALKTMYYEKMNPRRRKFIDRIGYDVWDPFEPPKEPMDIRVDVTKRTVQELVQEFMQTQEQPSSPEFARGVLECALGVVNREEKYLGMMDFCLWYTSLLNKEQIR